ncbi:MAG: ABC transporter ATP-binding protein/permease [Alphaproteobacteria bacterium]
MARHPMSRSVPAVDEDDTDKMAKPKRGWWTIKHLGKYLWLPGRFDLKLRVVVAFSTILLGQFIITASPALFGHAVDILNKILAGKLIVQAAMIATLWVVGFNVARFLSLAIQGLRDALFVKVGQNAQRAIAVETFEHLHSLSLRYHLSRQTGGLARLVTRGTNAIEEFLRFLLFIIVPTILQIILMCGYFTFKYGWLYTGVIIGMMIIYVYFSVKVTQWRNKFYRESIRRDAEAGNKSIDSLINFETVKYFNNEKWEVDRFGVAAQNYALAVQKSTSTLALLNFGQAVILSIGLGALMVMAQFDTLKHIITVGEFTAVMLYLQQLQQPLNQVGFMYRQVTQSLADMERMFALRDIPVEIVDKPDAKTIEVSGGEIRFEHVAFAYEPERPILKDVSFTIQPGHTVAVVGPSGAGKSTLARLLYRFYDVTGGRIVIDGQDVREVTQSSLRQQIGIVPQDTVLFNDTIRYNIAYGKPGASQDEIEAAAKVAQIHDFITRQPKGYDTDVGERGLKVSGGEKQRVAIARTVLKGPPILILDEATSALDTHTEMAIQSALDAAIRGRTSLVIAHRLSTIVNADQILVMDDGRIVEKGTHPELLKQGGLYASLWNRQRELDEVTHRLEEIEAAPEPHAGRRTREEEPVS